MLKCATCGAELEPPIRIPHTVYVKTLYRIAGQDYCRHHIIRAAVAAGSSPRSGPALDRLWLFLGGEPCRARRSFPGTGRWMPPSSISPGRSPICTSCSRSK